jgi:hypothetical protein
MNSTLVLALFAVLSVASAPRLLAGSKPLPPKHTKAGVSCYDCHQLEEPTKAPATSDACMNCHGDGPAMAAETAKHPGNPHKDLATGKLGPTVCFDCHGQHKTKAAALEGNPGSSVVAR